MFLDSIDFSDLHNIASELLEYEDEDEYVQKRTLKVGQKRKHSDS